MTDKLKESKLNSATNSTVDAARQMWMAGLGAFVRTGKEGGRLFSTLVEEGETFSDKTKQQTSDAVSGAIDTVVDRASGNWDKLESILEDRVIRVLDRLGVPRKEDITDLVERIDALQIAVSDLAAKKTPATKSKKTESAA